MEKIITVTSPLLPPLEEFVPYLEQIWKNKRLTNCGPFHQELEQALARYLGVGHLSLFANGTLALITALQALHVKGEVITTPYSFVATAHALVWNRLTPVFVDIDPQTFNIDPKKIEQAITPQTTAIMPVHCYGNPCDVEAIQAIADKHGLKVIFDGAHAFGVEDAGGSVLRHGDLSVLSLHATKVFNTFEGGAIISPDAQTKLHIDQLRNFGFVDEVTVVTCGINGKMSEVNAAFGLLQLQHIDEALEQRRAIDCFYRSELRTIKGINLDPVPAALVSNYAYFPIAIEPEYALSRDQLYGLLQEHNIFARRYFYPLITQMSVYEGMEGLHRHALPVAEALAEKVICLPIYPGLEPEDLQRIVTVIRSGNSANI
ncbi:DegT/DnrJ/EryC1/StrS family aminotransferase [Pseudomonas protegens]|uniref:DegT/DnrJ/EryC1/StrS family aminotransferase n=1 Tax=Pseudomonas protegens TaxID=380021 RepID=UPI00380EA15E